MNWINHPQYQSAKRHLVSALQQGNLRKFRRLRTIVFLCGGAGESAGRNQLRQYLQRNRPDCLVYYAEDVWCLVSDQKHLNALEMEDWLAKISDIVVIVVESPSALVELGAFALSDQLRKVLLPILDQRYADQPSFINTGPVNLINTNSQFSPAIVTCFTAISRCAGELEKRLNRVTPNKASAPVDVRNSEKHLLFMLCDIVAITWPITLIGVEAYIQDLLKLDNLSAVEMLLSLAVAMGLMECRQIDNVMYFCQSPEQQRQRAYLRQKYLNIPDIRATYLGTLGGIPDFQKVLEEIARGG